MLHGMEPPRGAEKDTGEDWVRPRRTGASLVAQPVKELPAVQETPVQLLGQEELLEKE